MVTLPTFITCLLIQGTHWSFICTGTSIAAIWAYVCIANSVFVSTVIYTIFVKNWPSCMKINQKPCFQYDFFQTNKKQTNKQTNKTKQKTKKQQQQQKTTKQKQNKTKQKKNNNSRKLNTMKLTKSHQRLFLNTPRRVIAQSTYSVKTTTVTCCYWLSPGSREVPCSSPGPPPRTRCERIFPPPVPPTFVFFAAQG